MKIAELLQSLADEQVQYVLVGGLAGVMVAAIDDLLAMKRMANRPKDQLDILALEKIRRGEDPNA